MSDNSSAPFAPGTKVYVDGCYAAVVAQAFPTGSSSYLFPHYKVHFVDGDRNVAVSTSRVSASPRCSSCGNSVPTVNRAGYCPDCVTAMDASSRDYADSFSFDTDNFCDD